MTDLITSAILLSGLQFENQKKIIFGLTPTNIEVEIQNFRQKLINQVSAEATEMSDEKIYEIARQIALYFIAKSIKTPFH